MNRYQHSHLSLQKLILEKSHNVGLGEVSCQLGYTNSEKCTQRIEKICASQYLALDKSGYDFKYSTREFIVNLCEVIGIPALFCQRVIKEVEDELQAIRQKFKAYIFVETGFKRKNQPIFMLAMMEHERRIGVDRNIRKLPLNEQLPTIQEMVTCHYQQTGGELQVWGKILKYVYFYDQDLAIEFSITGDVMKASTDYLTSHASISIGGKELPLKSIVEN